MVQASIARQSRTLYRRPLADLHSSEAHFKYCFILQPFPAAWHRRPVGAKRHDGRPQPNSIYVQHGGFTGKPEGGALVTNRPELLAGLLGVAPPLFLATTAKHANCQTGRAWINSEPMCGKKLLQLYQAQVSAGSGLVAVNLKHEARLGSELGIDSHSNPNHQFYALCMTST